ncbi:MAG: hypothetical protein Q7T33_00665 [Dehalococcoidia bacterium]|nr:hypothetical protein [Dehalococcoidia bacterium]
MTLFKRRFRIQSTRLPGWDYASAAWYFVTVCTGGRKPFLGEVAEGEVELTHAGTPATGARHHCRSRAQFGVAGL